MSWILSLPPLRIQTLPWLSYHRTILQMASPFLLSPSLANSLIKGVNPLILRALARRVVVESHLWLHSDGSFHHQGSLPHPHPHLLSGLSLLLGPSLKLILTLIRGQEFHMMQWSLRCSDHRLHKDPMSDSYSMTTVVFAYPLKTKFKLSNYLQCIHLNNIDSF